MPLCAKQHDLATRVGLAVKAFVVRLLTFVLFVDNAKDKKKEGKSRKKKDKKKNRDSGGSSDHHQQHKSSLET